MRPSFDGATTMSVYSLVRTSSIAAVDDCFGRSADFARCPLVGLSCLWRAFRREAAIWRFAAVQPRAWLPSSIPNRGTITFEPMAEVNPIATPLQRCRQPLRIRAGLRVPLVWDLWSAAWRLILGVPLVAFQALLSVFGLVSLRFRRQLGILRAFPSSSAISSKSEAFVVSISESSGAMTQKYASPKALQSFRGKSAGALANTSLSAWRRRVFSRFSTLPLGGGENTFLSS